MLVDGVDLVVGSKIRETIVRVQDRGNGFPANPSHGDKFFLVQATSHEGKNFQPGMHEYTSDGWIVPNPESGLTPYDISGTSYGKPAADSTILQCIITRKVMFSTNFAGSRALASTPPTAAVVLTVYKNDTQVGTITYAAGSSSGTFSGAAVSFYPGQVFKVKAPAGIDGDISDVMFTFAGSSV